MSSFTYQLTVYRPIKAGEEIVLPYVDPLLPRHERVAIINKRWRFICDCQACKTVPASDARRVLLRNVLPEFERRVNNYIEHPPCTPHLREPVALEIITGLRKALEAASIEGFDTGKLVARVKQLTWEMYMLVGDDQAAVELGKGYYELAKKEGSDLANLEHLMDVQMMRAMRALILSRAGLTGVVDATPT